MRRGARVSRFLMIIVNTYSVILLYERFRLEVLLRYSRNLANPESVI